jgi:MazG family protein
MARKALSEVAQLVIYWGEMELEIPKNTVIPDFSTPMDKLLWVMARLRDPSGGCPWDLEQDFKSIAPYTIEEAYEVADAIDRGDMKDLKEELGDLLLQAVYHAQMAKEQSLFSFDDVAASVADKMISRHPHVFGDKNAASADEVVGIWDAQKAKEKPDANGSIFDAVTKGLPALLRAQKLQKKAAKEGFTWTDSRHAWKKVEEEYFEAQEALKSGDKNAIADELGDLLFCLVNVARLEGLDSEEIMRNTNTKFINNFNKMKDYLKVKNKDISALSLDEMLKAWKDAKKHS